MRLYRIPRKADGAFSGLAAVAYDPSTKAMRLWFADRATGAITGVYDYAGVAAALIGELLYAESPTSFFQRNMRQAYAGTKLEEEVFEAAMTQLEAA